MDRILPTQENIWPTKDESYDIWSGNYAGIENYHNGDDDGDDNEDGSESVKGHGRHGKLSKEIFRIIKSTLKASCASPEARAKKIVNDIYFIISIRREIDGRQQQVYYSESLWDTFWDFARFLPYDHLYSEILLQAFITLEENQLEMRNAGEVPPDKKIDAATRGLSLREYHDAVSRPGSSDASHRKLWSIHWKNFMSFIARLIGRGYGSWGTTLWDLRWILENPIRSDLPYSFIDYLEPDYLETDLWVATEIFFFTGKDLYTTITTFENPTMDTARSYQTHALCSEIPPFGIERWEFWKKRCVEFAALAETYQLDSSTVARLTETVKHMDVIQQEGI